MHNYQNERVRSGDDRVITIYKRDPAMLLRSCFCSYLYVGSDDGICNSARGVLGDYEIPFLANIRSLL